ncbi:MAG: hypothetical protein ACYDEF_09480 [Methanosarcina sp.]
MSEIALWATYGNFLFSLIVAVLTVAYTWFDAYTWLTQNGNLLFSGIVAISTLVYTFLTWGLISETRKMRKVQTEPSLHVFIEARDEHNEITDMYIQNIGMGVARNLKFKVLSDFMYYRSYNLSKDYWLKDIHLLQNGLKALAPNQKIRVFSTSYRGVRELNSNTYIEIGIEYTNSIGDKYDFPYLLDFFTLPANGMSIPDPLVKSVEKIENYVDKISSNFGKFVDYSINNTEIMYTDYSRLLFAAGNDHEQIEIAKSLIKKTLLKFNYDWEACSRRGNRDITDSMLKVQSIIFLEVTAGVTGMLPEKLIEDLLSRINEMRNLSSEPRYLDNIDQHVSQFEEIANNILL